MVGEWTRGRFDSRKVLNVFRLGEKLARTQTTLNSTDPECFGLPSDGWYFFLDCYYTCRWM